MKNNLAALLGLLCIAHVALVGQQVTSKSSMSGQIYVTHVTMIDTVGIKEVRNQTVVINGDRISKISKSGSVKPPVNAIVVDGTDKYLIPGLWDMHVHALFPERLDSMFPMFIANGVLGIRDMGTSMPLADIAQLRKGIEDGSRVGPRIVASGPILDGRPKPLRPNFLAITTPEAGRAEVGHAEKRWS